MLLKMITIFLMLELVVQDQGYRCCSYDLDLQSELQTGFFLLSKHFQKKKYLFISFSYTFTITMAITPTTIRSKNIMIHLSVAT